MTVDARMPARLEISKDLSSFVQTSNQIISQKDVDSQNDGQDDNQDEIKYTCNISVSKTLTISSINDNGKVAVISAKVLDGQETYNGDRDDGTPCFDTVEVANNPDGDEEELEAKNPVAITITLDRTKGTLSIAPSNKSSVQPRVFREVELKSILLKKNDRFFIQ